MNQPAGAMKITPTNGTRSFRSRTSLAVENGTLVVTDRKGTTRRFPLNAGPESPTASVLISATPFGAFRSQMSIVDGSGEVLVLGYVGDWDSVEAVEFERAAGLTKKVEHLGEPKTQLRSDGLVLEDGTWWKRAPAASMAAFIVALITGTGVVPAALGWAVVIALMAFFVAGMTSGAYGKGRRGKGTDAEEAFLAGDLSAFDRHVEGTANPEPDSPEATT